MYFNILYATSDMPAEKIVQTHLLVRMTTASRHNLVKMTAANFNSFLTVHMHAFTTHIIGVIILMPTDVMRS